MSERDDEIGALWEKTSQKGTEYLSGTIDGQDVVIFRNTRKQGKQPDWRVYKSTARGSAPSRRHEGYERSQHGDEDDAIPF